MTDDILFKAQALKDEILTLKSLLTDLDQCNEACIHFRIIRGACESESRYNELSDDAIKAFYEATKNLIAEKEKEYGSL